MITKNDKTLPNRVAKFILLEPTLQNGIKISLLVYLLLVFFLSNTYMLLHYMTYKDTIVLFFRSSYQKVN